VFEHKSNICYSVFARLKPFWALKATEKDMEMCLCKTHENPYFKMNNPHDEKIINHEDLNELVRNITCDPNNNKLYVQDVYSLQRKIHSNKIRQQRIFFNKTVSWKVWNTEKIDREKKTSDEISKTTKHNVTLRAVNQALLMR